MGSLQKKLVLSYGAAPVPGLKLKVAEGEDVVELEELLAQMLPHTKKEASGSATMCMSCSGTHTLWKF